MDRIFEQLPPGVEAELYHLDLHDRSALFTAGKPQHCESRHLGGYALRLIQRRRLGFASVTDRRHSRELVQAALEAAELGREVDLAWPTVAVTSSGTDPQLSQVTTDDLLALTDSWQRVIHAVNPKFLVETRATLTEEAITVVNTRGGSSDSRRVRLALDCTAELVTEQDILNVYGGVSVGRWQDVDLPGLTNNLFGPLLQAPQIVPVTSGSYPVLLTSKAFAAIIREPLLAAFSGKSALQQTSPLADRQGEPVFSDLLTVIDDATLPMAPSSCSVDDEGVPTARFPLIESGVVRGFVYDLTTAADAAAQTSGHARRIGRTSGARLGALPQPGCSNVWVQPGELSFDQLVSTIDEGLIVDQISGTPGFNPGGDFSVTVQLGFRVQNGRITGRVKNAMLSGNAFTALNQIVALGCNTHWLGGGESGALAVPPMIVNGLRVTSR